METRRTARAKREARIEPCCAASPGCHPAGTSSNADRVDQHEPRDALGPQRRESQRDRGADVDADERGTRHAQRGERSLEIVGLRGEPEVGIERPVGLAVAEEVDGVRGVLRDARAPAPTFRHRKLQVPKPWISTTGAPPCP